MELNMTDEQAFTMIKEAVNAVSPGAGDKITKDTHLTEDDVLDSLDSMTFLFELETLNGKPFEDVVDTFDDYRVQTIIGLIQK